MDSVDIIDRRTQQLASAKKKLSNFRARGSDSQSTFNFPIPPLPLTTELSGNCPSPATKEVVPEGGGLDKAFSMNFKMEPQAHKRQGSMGHRRRPSSISHPAVPLRTSVTGLFESTTFGTVEGGLDLPNFNSTPPNPPPSNPGPPPTHNEDPVTPINNTDDSDSARAKFTSFSFGSKPPSTPLATLRTSSPSHSPKPSFSAPGSFNRLSTPLSRPPSLLVTRPTPLPFDQPLGSAPLSSPPSPARKRHSHTRSNSISMPNLKLGRPQSYSVLSSSPSFPSSPVSPDNSGESKINGRKLKFEPSGRGAEAEQQRDESRRKALEKLTGRSPTIPPPLEAAVEAISLPDEEEDNVDTTPYMYQGEIEGSSLLPAQFGRHGTTDSPESSDISPIITPSTWQSPTPSAAPAETWTRNADDHLGLGFGMDNTALKRASMPSALGVLTEEDESEDNSRGEVSFDHQEVSTVGVTEPAVPPTPSRLRELHLLSSSVTASPREESPHTNNRSLSESTPTRPLSVRRPRPLSGLGIGHAAFTASPSTATSTPLGRRRESRGSSISYKKDNDSIGSSTGSSREWSFNRLTSPTSLNGFGSPPASAQFAWPRADNHGEIEELASPIVASSRWAQAPSSSTPTATVDRGSSDRYSSSMTESSDYSWRDSRLELEMEKEALREDAELWKARCLNAEEHLKAERGETAILRERVRKLGDRLSSVSSSRLPPTQADESRPLAEMRDQLFSLMSLLEREQREKNQALSRISELEHQLHESHFQQTASNFQPILPSQAFGLGRLPPPSPTIIPPTPLPSSPEVSGNKMKSWGFPSRSRTPTPPKEKKRESFFGLSSVLKGPAGLEEHTGIDLPPISIPNEQGWMPPTSETVSSPALARSNSITSSASSVVQFLGGYLGRGRPSASTNDATRKGVLDLRGGCSCCTGEVFEL